MGWGNVEGPWEKVSEKEVWEALKRMKKGKSSGPSGVTSEMFSNDACVREQSVEWQMAC